MTSNEDSDTARIWSMSQSSLSRSLSKLRPSCCRDPYTVFPIALSLISLLLVLGTIFGVAVRWSQMQAEINELRAANNAPITSKQVARPTKYSPRQPVGVVYTRWGKKVCPGGATLVYAGFGGGSSSSSTRVTGGGSQYLCLPTNPEWNKFDLKNDSYAFSWIYAAEILSYTSYGIFADNVHGHNVACSVCHVPRSTKLMIPAKRTCPVGWTKEYEGYLMSSYVTHTKLTFECVDQKPDVIAGTQNITGGPQMFFVSGYCDEYGGLSHCPPYVNARELTCVMCTK